MPVDLTLIPNAASRKQPPSVKRWVVVLLIFQVCGAGLTLWLWPASGDVRGSLFWHCFFSAPLVLWVILLGVRWLYYLSSVWPAEGWDNEREQDIADEILRGQRSLILDGYCAHLPHVVTSGGLTQQFIIPDGVVLPAVVDESTKKVVYRGSFNDIGQALSERVSRRLYALLDDAAIHFALSRGDATRSLVSVVQIAAAHELSEGEITDIKKGISSLLPASSTIKFLPLFSLEDIDKYLDAADPPDALLILSVNIKVTVSDGDAEAAVALLLRSVAESEVNELPATRIHRPEHSRSEAALDGAIMQALQWGNIRSQDIVALWMSGFGIGSKAKVLLANSTIKFPLAEGHAQVIDVDMKSGCVGVTSPWLAIALAAGNTGRQPSPQLIMSISEKENLPWLLVVYATSIY